MGVVKCKKFAFARLKSTDEAVVASAFMVGRHGESVAIDWRSKRRGSCSEEDILRYRCDVVLTWRLEVQRLGNTELRGS